MNHPDVSDLFCAIGAGGAVVAASMIDVSDPVVVTVGTTVLGGLATAIKILWDRNNKLSETTTIALSKCEEEHKASAARVDVLTKQVISLTSEVGVMTGRIQGFQEATEKAERKQTARDAIAHGG